MLLFQFESIVSVLKRFNFGPISRNASFSVQYHSYPGCKYLCHGHNPIGTLASCGKTETPSSFSRFVWSLVWNVQKIYANPFTYVRANTGYSLGK